jgi:hemoglobin
MLHNGVQILIQHRSQAGAVARGSAVGACHRHGRHSNETQHRCIVTLFAAGLPPAARRLWLDWTGAAGAGAPCLPPVSIIIRVEESDIYQQIGEDGFARLIAAFYRQIPNDEILGPMYPAHDLAGAEQRLRDFLIFRFGGPMRYIEQRGHPRLGMRHMPFPINQRARDRWIDLMNRAFEEAALPPAAERKLREFFEGTASFLVNRQG